MNVSIYSLNSLIGQCGHCGTGFARYNGMSLKVDPTGGEDAPKNH